MGKNFKTFTPFFPSRAPTLLIVVMVSIWFSGNVPGVDGIFTRFCSRISRNGGCMFSTGSGMQRAFLFLGCDSPMCICEQAIIPDVPVWPLTWDQKNGTCLTAAFGPCGTDRGLEIGCQPGFECIEDRCRDPMKLGQTSEGQICFGQMDCVDGLACERVDSPGPWDDKRCLQPREQQAQENITENVISSGANGANNSAENGTKSDTENELENTAENPVGTTSGPDNTAENSVDTKNGPENTAENSVGTKSGPENTAESPVDTNNGPENTAENSVGTKSGPENTDSTKNGLEGIFFNNMLFTPEQRDFIRKILAQVFGNLLISSLATG